MVVMARIAPFYHRAHDQRPGGEAALPPRPWAPTSAWMWSYPGSRASRSRTTPWRCFHNWQVINVPARERCARIPARTQRLFGNSQPSVPSPFSWIHKCRNRQGARAHPANAQEIVKAAPESVMGAILARSSMTGSMIDREFSYRSTLGANEGR